MIKAIETVYNGYKFRSRLEARWAVFFDTLGVKYRYEAEGYDLEGDWYLPDFWMSDWECWVEIKPDKPVVYDSIEKKEYRRCSKLAKFTNQIVLLVGGNPWVKNGFPYSEYEYDISLFAPSFIAEIKEGSLEGIDTKIPFVAGGGRSYREETYVLSSALYGFIVQTYDEHPDWFDKPLPKRGDVFGLIKADCNYFFLEYGKDHPSWRYGIVEDNFHFAIRNSDIGIYGMDSFYDGLDSDLIEAYTAARQARFEHLT